VTCTKKVDRAAGTEHDHPGERLLVHWGRHRRHHRRLRDEGRFHQISGLSLGRCLLLYCSGDRLRATFTRSRFIDGKFGLDDGGVKATGAPGGTAAALSGKHGLDLFFADANVRQSGFEAARLLLFGATLVGLGAVVRRRMRGDATPKV
jgi:hypothetical protein